MLVGRFSGQGVADHGLARQLGVGADEAELGFFTGFVQGHGKGVLEGGQGAEGAVGQGAFGHPGRVFVHAVEQLGGHIGRGHVHAGQ